MASGHGGQGIYVVPEFDLVAVIVQQVFDNPMADANAFAIMSRYILPAAGGAAEKTVSASFDDDRSETLAGTYRSDRAEIVVEIRGATVWVLAERTPPLELEAVGRNRFRGAALGLIDVDFLFEINDGGEVVGVVSSWGFTEDRFVKVGEGALNENPAKN